VPTTHNCAAPEKMSPLEHVSWPTLEEAHRQFQSTVSLHVEVVWDGKDERVLVLDNRCSSSNNPIVLVPSATQITPQPQPAWLHACQTLTARTFRLKLRIQGK